MTNEKIVRADNSRMTRILTISLFVVISMLMLSLAMIAHADTLARELEIGSKGDDVSSLQTFLAADSNVYPQGLITGYFGFLTKSAVSNLQSQNGIPSVGRVGPITLSFINQRMNGDTTAPQISSLSVNPSTFSASMSWSTNENSSAVIYYSTTPLPMTEGTAVTIGGSSLLVHADLRVSHSATISSLAANTTYYYVVYVRDGAGNETTTWPSTFHTNQ